MCFIAAACAGLEPQLVLKAYRQVTAEALSPCAPFAALLLNEGSFACDFGFGHVSNMVQMCIHRWSSMR